MIVLADLDHTLFNTNAFRKMIAAALEVTDEQFKEHEKQITSAGRYSDVKHLQLLKSSRNEADIKKAEMRMELVWQNIRSCLFPQTISLLRIFRELSYPVTLLTLGDTAFQKEKIKRLKLEKEVENAVVTEITKKEFVKTLRVQGEDVLILNDNAKECLEMRDVLGRAEIRLIDGIHSNNTAHHLPVLSLAEVFEEFFIKRLEHRD